MEQGASAGLHGALQGTGGWTESALSEELCLSQPIDHGCLGGVQLHGVSVAQVEGELFRVRTGDSGESEGPEPGGSACLGLCVPWSARDIRTCKSQCALQVPV